MLLFAYKALNGLAPPYLADLLKPYPPTRSLRSADRLLLVVPKWRLKQRGDRAFAVAAPNVWNELPLQVRLAPTLPVCKCRLKTHFSSLAFTDQVTLLHLGFYLVFCIVCTSWRRVISLWLLIWFHRLVFHICFMSCLFFMYLCYVFIQLLMSSTLFNSDVFKCAIEIKWIGLDNDQRQL